MMGQRRGKGGGKWEKKEGRLSKKGNEPDEKKESDEGGKLA